MDVDDPHNPAMNPWHPMTDAVDLKHLGKLNEESGELSSVSARCIIQGIDEAHPETGQINRHWLEDEIADVQANSELVIERFELDRDRIARRVQRKKELLRTWHKMA